MNPAQILSKNLSFNLGGVPFASSYLQALLIVFLLFVLVLSLARMRRLFVKWSISGWQAWLFMGFLLALVMEGFLLIGGKTILTATLGWENAPKPIQTALEAGRNGLTKVLGVKDEISISTAKEEATIKNMMEIRNIVGKNKFQAFIAYSEDSVVK